MRQLDGLKEKTNEELLAMYDRDRQLEVKQELTLRYLYIAKAVAIQMHNLYADFMQMEDIINEGAIAIMKGIERYDPEPDDEIAGHLKMDIRKCQRLQRMSTMVNVLSLDMVTNREEEGQSVQIPSGDMDLQPETAYMREEAVRTLTEAVNKLKEKERMVISLYYVEDLNMTQIAQVLNVSEPRISQIHSSAIRKLKTYMNTYIYE